MISNNNINELHYQLINDSKTDEIKERLKSNPHVTALHIIGPFARNAPSLGPEGGKSVMAAVKIHPSIQTLNLEGNNGMGDRVAPAIAELLIHNKVLRHLNLRDCNLTDSGAKIISEAMEINKTLQNIQLDTNRISSSLISRIQACVARNCGATPERDPQAHGNRKRAVSFGDNEILGTADTNELSPLRNKLVKQLCESYQTIYASKCDRQTLFRLQQCVDGALDEILNNRDPKQTVEGFTAAVHKLLDEPGEGSSNVKNERIKQLTDLFAPTLLKELESQLGK